MLSHSNRVRIRVRRKALQWVRRCAVLPSLLLAGSGLGLGFGLVATSAAAVQLHEQVLKRAQWPTPATGRAVLGLAAVQQALRRFAENGKVTVVISYPGGDPGRQWAAELHDWLVIFGVPTQYLQIQLGSGAADQLLISVIDRS